MRAAFLVGALIALWVSPSNATQLLSIEGFDLAPNEYVSSFQIETFGFDFYAVCHIPPGWIITAGTDGTPDGTLSGTGGLGVT